MLSLYLIAFLAIFITFLYRNFTYWQRKGVPIPFPPNFLIGHSTRLVFHRENFGCYMKDIYLNLKKKKAKFGGFYLFFTKMFMPIDLNLLKHILVKDFDSFKNRGFFSNPKVDPLSANLFSLEDEKWKNMRTKLSPTFTSGKMKLIYNTMLDCTQELENIIDNCAKTGQPVDLKEVLNYFTIDIIGSCVFGIKTDAQKNKDSTFTKTVKKVIRSFPILTQFLSESLLKLIKYKSIPDDVSDFYKGIVKETIEQREKNNIYRKDFMHLLIQLKNRGVADGSEKIHADDESFGQKETFSLDEITAQAFSFFLAGFDPTSSAMTFGLYEIARNPDIQNKLREEIRNYLKKNNGIIDYYNLMEMKYLDAVVTEILRKYPVATQTLRICNRDYRIPDSDIVLSKGTKLVISIMGIHYDDEYYPNPEKFNPERFNEDNKTTIPSFAYLPFGEGPRNCIGMRFAIMQIKVGLMTVLKNHAFTLNEKAAKKITFGGDAPLLDPKNQVILNIKKIN